MAPLDFLKALIVSLLGGVSLCLVSCSGGSGGGDDAASAGGRKKSLDDFQYSKTDVVYGEAGTDTEGMIVGGRRSNFEGKRQVVFGGNFEGKTYGTDQYKSKSWNGSKNYGRKSYSGNTNASQLKVASVMDGQTARGGGEQSRYSGSGYNTSNYNTSSAREGQATPVNRNASNYAAKRLPLPKVMSEREYQKMTIEETNSLLGRDR